MRAAKIQLYVHQTAGRNQAAPANANWLPEQDTPLAREIKDEIMAAVALEHKQAALDGYQYVVYDYATDARGILCYTNGEYIVRLKNKDVLSLQASTQHFIEEFHDLPRAVPGGITFRPIQILEKAVRHPMLEGYLLRDKKEKLAYARQEKFVEFATFRFAALFALCLMAATFSNTLISAEYLRGIKYGAQIEWFFDILQKLVGSSVMTAIISYMSYRAFLKSLEHTIIRWQIPKVKDTLK